MKRGLIWAAAAVITTVMVLVVIFASRFGSDPSLVDSPLIGEPLPDVRLPYLETDGELVLAALDGEILVVNFWASWCIPCRAEHPILLNAARDYEPFGVRVVGIVYQDDPDNAAKFLDEFGRGYDIVVDPNGRAAIEFGVFGVPETFFIGRDGTIAAKVNGPVNDAVVVDTLNALVFGGEPSEAAGD